MSHDPEAEDAMAKALHEIACPCGCWPCCWEANPDDPTDEAAEVSMARYRRDAPRMLRYLAAAGYTVTRDALPIDRRRYRLDAEYHAAVYTVMAMNREAEGSTDD